MVTQADENTHNPNTRIGGRYSSPKAIFVDKFGTIGRILSGTFFNGNK